MKLESELKFAVAQPVRLRARLHVLGFRIAIPRRLESNWLFDDSGASLCRRGALLRLRRSGTGWWLTAKGPRRPGVLKQRPEAEFALADGPAARALLAVLGFRESFAYALHRTVYRQPRQRGELDWDQTPFGVYLEIEGSPAWVLRTARALELDPAGAESRSYPELFQMAASVPSQARN